MRRHDIPPTALICWIALLFFLCLSNNAVGQSPTPNSSSTSIKELLNPDGSLNLSSGFSGSVNPAGYRMITGPNGEPRFVPADASHRNVATGTETGTDDAYWDDRFFFPATFNNPAYAVNNYVYALAVSGTNLYAAGNFTTAGGVTVNRVAKWDGSTWSALGSGMNGPVYALAVSGSYLYAGGDFTTAGGTTVNRITRWDGSGWGLLGGVNSVVYALAVSSSGDLYAGGAFTSAGGVSVLCIAKWNGSSWSAVGGGVGGIVNALVASGSDLYVAGDFTVTGGGNANRIAKWNGSSWSALGSGMNSYVYALAVSSTGDLYAGGNFTTAGGVTANRIAKWNGSSWSALGSGMNGYVLALAVSDTILFAGGDFTTAGGETVNRIAKWDGSSWSALENGMNNRVSALGVIGTDVFAGGSFTTAGDVSVKYLAKWDGTSWPGWGSGMNSYVYALAVSDTVVYAGGNFTTAGGVTVNRIAKWNGTSWSALGSGVDSYVYALAVSGTDLYAGGMFPTAGGIGVYYIAKWDGSTWSALGGGVYAFSGQGRVNALAVSGDDLYAGGTFERAGGVSVYNIAKWNGSSWSALGSGLGYLNTDQALAVSGTNLYVGGAIQSAGGKLSYYVGRWFKPTSAAAVTKTFATPTSTPVSFHEAANETAVDVSISSSSGGPTVLVNRYEDAPKDSSSIADTANVSRYRWTIQQLGLAPSSTGTVRFDISQIPAPGISDPNSVVVYRRPAPGKGAFTAVTTTYQNGELVASGSSGFGEFAFGSKTNELPVQIVELSAVASKASVSLHWPTATEVNNHGFGIERRQLSNLQPALSNLQWITVAFVPGAGSSTSPREYSYTDKGLAPGRYAYRIKQIDNGGTFTYTGAVEVEVGLVPRELTLAQNYPNPFNPSTTIEFTLAEDGKVMLKVFDLLGREVATVVNEELRAGVLYRAEFDGSKLSTGLYFCRLEAGASVRTRKLLLLK